MTDWHDILYVKNAKIYRPILEDGLPTALPEVKGLVKIFTKYGLSTRNRKPRILDVSCGIGRHSVYLAKLGYQVVGFDFSPYFLNTARKLARQHGLSNEQIRFYEDDTTRIQEILDSEGEARFDAIICMDTSIVRPTLQEEMNLLHSMYKLGNQKSLLVVETANRDLFLKKRIPVQFVQYFPKAKLQRHILGIYDPKKKQIKGEWRFYRQCNNGDLKHLLSIKLVSTIHSRKDLRTMIEDAGWKYLRSYGSIRRLDLFNPNSYHIVMVAKKR